MNNKITERDKVELSSYWAYQKLQQDDTFRVNEKDFKVIEVYPNSNKYNGDLDSYKFELIDENAKFKQQFIVFQGTNNTKKINPNNPFRNKLADDWLANLKLINKNNKTTPLLNQSNHYINKHIHMIVDAKKLSEKEFFQKYNVQRSNYLNKILVGIGGNSQGGASSTYQGIQHRNIPITSTNGAMLPLSSYDYLGVPY